jgi:ferrous-iron efflux pump FieF
MRQTSALRIGHEAVPLRLDHELPPAQRGEIIALARAAPRVLDVHGLRTRKSGQMLIIQLHLEPDDDLPLREAHRVALEAESRIRGHCPHSDIIIHQDPVSLGDEKDDLATDRPDNSAREART